MSSAKALPWTPAIETSTASDRAPVQGGWSPKPTAAPNEPLQALEILKRQKSGTNTCGYFNGVESEPYTCAGAGYCAHNSYSAIGCCTGDLDSCDIFTACVDYSLYSAVCFQAGSLTGCCNDASYPYCATYLWNNPQRSMIRCVDSPAFYLMSDHPVTDAGSMTVPPIVTIPQSFASVASSIQDGNDAQDVTSASGNVMTSAGARSSASSSSSATTETHKKSSVPLGAIIGGVIGGVAVIVLLVFAIILLIRRKKSKPSPPQHLPHVSAILPNNPYQGPSPNSPPPFYENRASIGKPVSKNPKELSNTVYIPPAISEYYQPPKDNPPVSPNTDTQRYSDHQIYRDPDYQYSELDATALNSLGGNGVELDGVAGSYRPSHGTEIEPSR
ncbi:hypothetical protein EYC80_005111 [Monilinia laxa]|uniref:Mid2 domain-containing protein n=1 Tax=Monilinia laxa TaxID=61186 RepID=A0A5N6KJ84_MONLA|nr:hypothetical protein EYC80_005111 [Monilinia laxa]